MIRRPPRSTRTDTLFPTRRASDLKKMAKYLRNAWYAAAWSEEIGGTPLGRTFLEQPVVLFRETDGTTVALADRCPHRFAPLSKGKLVGNAIECPYHGLRFGADEIGRAHV